MTTITTRSGKGSPLTNNEVDANFTNLNDDKVEASGDSMTGDLSFGDNNKVILGAGSDLQIYHDGSHSYIDDAGTGLLRLRSNTIYLEKYTGELLADFNADGYVSLLHDNSEKFRTTSTGIDVSGNVAVSAAGARRIDISNTSLADTGEMASLQWDANADLTFQGRASDGTFKANWYRIESSDTDGLADAHRFYTDSSVERMNITSTGIDVTGTVTADGGTFDGNVLMNSSNELQFFNTNYGIRASTGLEIKTGDFTRFLEGSTEHMRIASGGDVSFYNSAGTSQDLYWDASTSRLGLGTTSPSSALTVAVDDATGDNGARIAGVTDGNKQLRLAYNTTGNYANIQAIHAGTAYTNLVLQKDGGNVGIGTSSPANLMHLEGTGVVVGATQLTLEGRYNGYGAGLEFVSRTSSGGTRATMAKITADGEAAWNTTASTQDAGLRFSTTEGGTLSEKVRISASGNVGIGRAPVGIGAFTIVEAYNNASSGGFFNAINNTGEFRFVKESVNGYINMTDSGSTVFESNGSERMRINSSGDWMVSNTVANPASAYTTQGGCGWVESDNHFEIATTSNRSALEVGKNNATNGSIITLRKQSTVVGSLDTDSVGFLLKNPRANSYISLLANNQSSGIFFQDGTTKTLAPYSSRDAEFDLGLSNSRFKNLYLSGGTVESISTVTSSSNAATLNLSTSTNFVHALTENVTYTFSNPAASGSVSSFTLKVTQDTTARTITWPTSVDWAGGTAPTLSTASGAVDIFVFFTHDGGTTYYGFAAGQDMK